jgi:tripartite-type tricarboxylate transporter receptor subunit TctC
MKTIPFVAAVFTALQLLAFDVAAQSWPARPVTVVVPYPPGGTNDVVARLYAERLGRLLGQSFLIDNRGGAAGMVGTGSVAKAAPDGYVLMVGNNGTHVIQPLVSASIQYDPIKDFTPIAQLVEAPQFLGVHAQLPITTVGDLIQAAKREPGKLNYGSAGSGSFGNFAGEMLKLQAGIDVVHIPYRGSGPAVADLAAGRVQFMLDPVVVGQIKSGRVRVIATTSPQRFPGLPDVPTMIESGLPSFVLVGWFGMFGPANLPKEIVSRLFDAISATSKDADLPQKILAAGIVPSVKGPQELASTLKADLQRYEEIKRRAKIKVVE